MWGDAEVGYFAIRAALSAPTRALFHGVTGVGVLRGCDAKACAADHLISFLPSSASWQLLIAFLQFRVGYGGGHVS